MIGNGGRGQGIGSNVIEAMHNIVRSQGDISKITAVIDRRNIASIRLFEKKGYIKNLDEENSSDIEYVYYTNQSELRLGISN